MKRTPPNLPWAPRSTEKQENAYAILRKKVTEEGLLKTQPLYYSTEILASICLFILAVIAIPRATTSLRQFCAASFLAFASTRLGFIVHDAGHKQVSRLPWKNDLIGILCADLLLGFSYSCWVETHNRHHRHPNQCGMDPDIEFPLLAFSTEQALKKSGIARQFVKYQVYLFLPLLLFEALSLKVDGFRFLLAQRTKFSTIDLVLLALHYLFWCSFLLHYMGPARSLAFAAEYLAVFGFSLGMIFVTNHKGMPLLDKNSRLDFVTRQVVTARNLRVNLIVGLLFGGLTCQIEHHLFPRMPRNRLPRARHFIQAHCSAQGIHYYETGLTQCYLEVINHLRDVGHALR
jgi:fatty acid desaturase